MRGNRWPGIWTVCWGAPGSEHLRCSFAIVKALRVLDVAGAFLSLEQAEAARDAGLLFLRRAQFGRPHCSCPACEQGAIEGAHLGLAEAQLQLADGRRCQQQGQAI